MNALEKFIRGTPYASYPYTYPHKTAYRAFEKPLPLADLWAQEPRDALFLYMHVPFCETRCGYCNLFTLAGADSDFQAAYVDTLKRQAQQVRTSIGDTKIAQIAIGGGTPTLLNPGALETLFEIATDIFEVDFTRVPLCIESSPRTITRTTLQQLKDHHVQRLSIGVQSFIESETLAIGRPQSVPAVKQALELIRAMNFPTFNIDLIYGIPGQSVESWLTSLRTALHYRPEEIYLYPLYVRPLTGLDARRGPASSVGAADNLRLACYRTGRDSLLEAGYTQLSMRLFRRSDNTQTETRTPEYRCQEDGMIGLGCGARSYTREYHYASTYAVKRGNVKSILDDFVQRPTESFGYAHHGIHVDTEDRQRRYVIKSLFRPQGLALADFRRIFHTELLAALPELQDLLDLALATSDSTHLRLNAAGLERTDAIGPWLYSAKVKQLIADAEQQ